MKNIIKALAFSAVAFAGQQVVAQESNTLFFDKNNYRSHLVNPANMYYGRLYIGVPGASNISLMAGNSDLVFTDIIDNVKVDGMTKTVLFMDADSPDGVSKFLGALKGRERLFAKIREDIVDFGFRTEKGFLNFNIALRGDFQATVPAELFKLAFRGMDEGETFDLGFNKLSARLNTYGEFSVGYSRNFFERFTFGAKAKYLYGIGAIKSDFKNLKATIAKDEWRVSGDGSIVAACPSLFVTTDENGDVDEIECDFHTYNGGPQGAGLAVDLGAVFRCLPNLNLSASLLDFGFLRYGGDLASIDKKDDFVYNGVKYDFTEKNGDYFDEYEDAFKVSFKKGKPEAFTEFLTPTINLGAEYLLWDDRFGAGLLSRTYLYRTGTWQETVISANFRPRKRLSMSLAYSVFDTDWTNLDASINFGLGPVNMYFALDNIPVKYAKDDTSYIPSNIRFMRLNLGFAVTLK